MLDHRNMYPHKIEQTRVLSFWSCLPNWQYRASLSYVFYITIFSCLLSLTNMNLNSAARVSPVLRLDRPKERERSREKERERERELEESRSEQSARGTARAARALARARDEGSNHRSQ